MNLSVCLYDMYKLTNKRVCVQFKEDNLKYFFEPR